jgi:hypothetical protein
MRRLYNMNPTKRAKQSVQPTILRSVKESMLASISMQTHEGALVTILSRKIGALSCISQLIHQDMKYVGKRWQMDLE